MSANREPGWSDTMDSGAFNRRRTTRFDQIRLLACQKFRELSNTNNQPVEITTLQRAVQSSAPADIQLKMDDFSVTLDIIGDDQNGGGSFDQRAENGRVLVYFIPDDYSDNHPNHHPHHHQHHTNHGPIRAGDIGSPIPTGAIPLRSQAPLGRPQGTTSSPAGF